MRVLVAPDKFKGTLSAAEVADAIAEGLNSAGLESVPLPLADGGDGSVEAALSAGYSRRQVRVRGADGHQIHATFATDGTTAVIEVANTCGLSTLPTGVRAPMTSSSFGFGQAVLAARDTGARRLVLALGGSASTDGGAGMLAALGVVFLDADGRTIDPDGAALAHVANVDSRALADLDDVELVVAADVSNPLTGPHGAAAVFGPQKGATAEQVVALDAGLDRFAQVLASRRGRDAAALAIERGAGAAGGLGFACSWLGGRRVAGAEFFLDLLGFDQALLSCSAVVTGEGCIDSQTLHGKLPAVVAQRATPHPVYAVVGHSRLGTSEQSHLGLEAVHALTAMTEADPSIDPTLSRALAAQAGKRIGHQLHATALSHPVEH